MPLIPDIVENIGIKSIFIKIDLRWGYNNIWIKEGDKLKIMFTTLERLFKLKVIFFGLTNLLVIFQTIMNKILWDLINTRKVASFIDDVIVGIETEKGHNEIVKEVVNRLAENDLYIKLEKYK